jgi:hypothetical protein
MKFVDAVNQAAVLLVDLGDTEYQLVVPGHE